LYTFSSDNSRFLPVHLSVQGVNMSRSEILEKAIQEIVKEEIEKFKSEQSNKKQSVNKRII